MINYARFIGVNPENALERTNKKFSNRFQFLEKAAKTANKELSEMTLNEMDVYWNNRKNFLNKSMDFKKIAIITGGSKGNRSCLWCAPM